MCSVEADPLPVVSLASLSSHSVGCLFLSRLPFLCKRKSRLFLFSLLQAMDPRRCCCDSCQREFCLLPSSSFTVASLISRSVTHRVCVCVWWWRRMFSFLPHGAVQFRPCFLCPCPPLAGEAGLAASLEGGPPSPMGGRCCVLAVWWAGLCPPGGLRGVSRRLVCCRLGL